MRPHISGIDHCFILVRDLDGAKRTYERLGFTNSPLGRHGSNRGTGNHTMMLEHDYIELLGVLERTDASAKWLDVVREREGLHSLALRTSDAAAVARDLRADGISADDAVEFARPVDLPGGLRAEARFRTARVNADESPHLGLFCCEHLTPQHTWIPSLMRHPNTAYGIARLTVLVNEPHREAAAAACIVGSPSAKTGPEEASVSIGSAAVLFMTLRAFRATCAGTDFAQLPAEGPCALRVRVRDIASAQACLQASGVSYHRQGDVIVVPPREACGVLISFEQAQG